MFAALKKRYKEKYTLDIRAFKLFMYDKVLNGTLYDILDYSFYEEYKNGGTQDYIPLQNRRPCVKFNICKKVVEDSTSLLFSEGHFPDIYTKDSDTRKTLNLIAKYLKLNSVFMEASFLGSIGSVAISVGLVEGQLFYQPISTVYLTPKFDSDKLRNLIEVTQKYRVLGHDLMLVGYDIAKDDLDKWHWFQRVWNTAQEIYYIPWKEDDESSKKKPKIDKDRTTKHNLGFVPIVWVRNLPGGTLTEGLCTFQDAIDIMIETDYQLSQGGRGLRYSADPTLLIKAPSSLTPGEKITRSANNALFVPEDGDARLLEIAGTAAQAVQGYVRNLREFALEVIHGNRANTDKLTVAQSGKAMEMMNQDLIWLADRLRTSYGEGALVDVLRMTLRIIEGKNVELNGSTLPPVKPYEDIVLRWKPWYSYTPDDLQKNSLGLATFTDKGIISRETATRFMAATFDIEDVDSERNAIKQEKAVEPAEKTSGNGNNSLDGTKTEVNNDNREKQVS